MKQNVQSISAAFYFVVDWRPNLWLIAWYKNYTFVKRLSNSHKAKGTTEQKIQQRVDVLFHLNPAFKELQTSPLEGLYRYKSIHIKLYKPSNLDN